MRISDWSSDVCSSDLLALRFLRCRPVGGGDACNVGVDRTSDTDVTDRWLRNWHGGGRGHRGGHLRRCDVLRGRWRGCEGNGRYGDDELHWRDSGAGCAGAARLGSRGEPSGRLTAAGGGGAGGAEGRGGGGGAS